MAFSPDGKYVLAGGADNRIRVWRFVSKTKQVINPLVHARFAHEGAVVDLDFSSDGRFLVSTSEDRSLKLWEAGSYTQVYRYDSQSDEISGMAVSPLEPAITVGRLDGSLQRYPIAGRAAATSENRLAAVAATPVPMPADMRQAQDTEPNDEPAQATVITAPAKVAGVIHPTRDGQTRDADLYRFTAKAGQEWMIEINAARQKSPLDSKVEVLDSNGKSIARAVMQAVRDSYFTFRGKNSDTIDDFSRTQLARDVDQSVPLRQRRDRQTVALSTRAGFRLSGLSGPR